MLDVDYSKKYNQESRITITGPEHSLLDDNPTVDQF